MQVSSLRIYPLGVSLAARRAALVSIFTLKRINLLPECRKVLEDKEIFLLTGEYHNPVHELGVVSFLMFFQAWTLVLYQHVVTKAVGNSRSLWFGKAGASILSSKKQILRARPFPSFSKIWSAGISALIQSSAGSSSPNFRNCNTKLWLRLALQPITVRKKENVVVIQLCCSFCIVQHVDLSKHV